MRIRLALIGPAILAVGLTAPILAMQTAAPASAPGTKNAAAVTGGTYQADAGHTLVVWEVDHLGFSPYWGMFGDITGTIQIDPRNPTAAKVDMIIPVAKVTTASAGLTQHLLKPAEGGKKPDFFGADPADARFVSTRVDVKGDDEASVTGNLTLNGVTRPVTLDVEFYGAGKAPAMMGGKENLGFKAKGTIRRSEFGIGFGIPMVSDEVTLKIAAAFQK